MCSSTRLRNNKEEGTPAEFPDMDRERTNIKLKLATISCSIPCSEVRIATFSSNPLFQKRLDLIGEIPCVRKRFAYFGQKMMTKPLVEKNSLQNSLLQGNLLCRSEPRLPVV